MKNTKMFVLVILITILVFLCGCATVVNGTTQDIPIISTPTTI